MIDVSQFVSQLHHAGTQFVLAVTGGGSEAISALFTVPGASRSMLLASVPYSAPALIEWLGARPEQFCANRTARSMAMAGFLRAQAMTNAVAEADADKAPKLCGLACTASLASDRPKRGDHRFYLAAQTAGATHTLEVTLTKSRRSRAEEESLVAAAILNLAAEVAGLTERISIDWQPNEIAIVETQLAHAAWQALFLGQTKVACVVGTDSAPKAIFPGSFNPRHAGHRQMAELAEQIIGAPVAHELALRNVDKPPLDYLELAKRLNQFDPAAGESVWLTRLPTFVEKADAFPGATFVVGADTIERLADPRYYDDNVSNMLSTIEHIARLGCRFLVFGREIDGKFETLSNLNLPTQLTAICGMVPEELFRADISSTKLRQKNGAD